MNFLATIWNEDSDPVDGTMQFVVWADSVEEAESITRAYAEVEGISIESIDVEEYSVNRHGDVRDYEQLG